MSGVIHDPLEIHLSREDEPRDGAAETFQSWTRRAACRCFRDQDDEVGRMLGTFALYAGWSAIRMVGITAGPGTVGGSWVAACAKATRQKRAKADFAEAIGGVCLALRPPAASPA